MNEFKPCCECAKYDECLLQRHSNKYEAVALERVTEILLFNEDCFAEWSDYE